MKTKEQLRKELNAVIAKEHKELVDKHYPEFQKLVGTFYKYRNSYGGDRKWWLYRRVDKIERKDIYVSGDNVLANYSGVSFEITCDGHVHIELVKTGYCHGLGQEISEAEFNEAWNKTVDLLNSI